LLGFINPLLRQRRILIATVALTGFVFVGWGLLRTRTYTTGASFLIEGRRSSSLQGLAAQFGIAVPAQEGGQSPNFYADLIREREILNPVVDSVFTEVGGANGRGPHLWELLHIKETDPAARRERTIRALQDRVTATVAQRTGVVSFTVKTDSPRLSWSIAQRIVAALNTFNLRTRQSQAAAERRFTEGRLTTVRGDLQAAEAELLAFTQRNRDIRSAPELQVQQERLQREVSLRQQVFTTLAQAVEQAKIEEVRDTPVISPVAQPIVPPLPDDRGLGRLALIALLLGGVIGSALAISRDRSRRPLPSEPDAVEFNALLSEIGSDLRHPWRLLSPSAARPD
jgi:uncharacterized protein involved in exopolysaccharide biosynthesis